MSLAELMTTDMRLVVLRLLAEASGYTANDSILHSALGAMGHNVSRDRVRTEMSWLREQGLIELYEVAGVQVATLTARGLDAAEARATVPGVKRPSPRG